MNWGEGNSRGAAVEVSRGAAFLVLGCHHVAGIELTNYKLWAALILLFPCLFSVSFGHG